MSYRNNHYTHIHDTWDDALANRLSPLEALVYRSNRLGEDHRITPTGGGSTSLKVIEKDPVSGQPVEVIWIKSAGTDLKTSRRSQFSPLYQERLMALRHHYQRLRRANTRPTTSEPFKAATFNRAAPAPSVDTPLHALMPYAHVNHIHPCAAIAVGACKNSRALTQRIWGHTMLWVPQARPGFEQGIPLQAAWNRNPDAKGALLAGNGIATWSDDNRLCYRQTLDIIEAASRYIAARDKGDKTFGGPRHSDLRAPTRQNVLKRILPFMIDLVSDGNPVVGTVESGADVMRFVNSVDAPRLAAKGVACLHHLRHTKLKPLYIPWNPEGDTLETLKQKLEQGVARYRDTRRGRAGSSTQGEVPAVCLIPGVGLIALGQSKKGSRLTAEAYQNAIEVMRCAEAIDTYVGLSTQEAQLLDSL
ncbi:MULTISPECIES: class II aldolase/adducin family protein [unclassified Marinimicrobium]|jgi:rhamnose utilization protein RhaD (predicted bifunctional aldolase and dehydrogenase)|uniref:class II aldolase/adducin family protein n=1 Tax=unclassified Marinimicrobium TaxID=2632100 RepID=UPI00257B01EB|nr:MULTISPECIES: class II aldolase/adducin family protein [unclassified Marinimicrobium]